MRRAHGKTPPKPVSPIKKKALKSANEVGTGGAPDVFFSLNDVAAWIVWAVIVMRVVGKERGRWGHLYAASPESHTISVA
jgi:hypothetical protein